MKSLRSATALPRFRNDPNRAYYNEKRYLRTEGYILITI